MRRSFLEAKRSRLATSADDYPSQQWWFMVSPDASPEEHAEISRNLKEYCGLDTYAMYAIWKHLYEVSR